MSHAVIADVPAPTEGCTETPIIRERGQREVFCGLTGIIWMHRKIQDAFFLIVGSRTCAHLMQSAAGVMIFAEPRFATAIIDERDLAGMSDANDELDRVAAQVLERRPDIKMLFLVGSCPSEVIKLDLSRAAERLNAVRAGRAHPELFGQRHRDDLHPGRGQLPGGAGARPARSSAERAGRSTPGGGLPGGHRRGPAHPHVGRARRRPGALPAAQKRRRPAAGRAQHRYLLAQPFLGETAKALEDRGATRLDAPFPLGAEGTTGWLKAAADHWGVDAETFETAVAPARRRAQTAVAHFRERLEGQRIFFFPDSQLELPLARFLARECGMVPVEVGTPYLHGQHMAQEVAWPRRRPTAARA